MRKLRINSDGGCRTNPGPAGAGCVAYQIDEEGKPHCIYEKATFIEKASNNGAEYTAMGMALEYALSQDYQEVEIQADSKLVVEQVNRNWQVKAVDLIPLYEDCAKKLKALRARGVKVIIKWVPREQNQHADSLANLAMDRKTGCEYKHTVNLEKQMSRCLDAMIKHENLVLELIKHPKQIKNKRADLAMTWEEVVQAWADMKVTF
jgi:ribonuclease HI